MLLTVRRERSQLASGRQGLDAVPGPARDRLDRERWVHATDRREHRAVANPQVAVVPRPAVRIHDARPGIVAHPGATVHVAGVVLLLPDLGRVDRPQRLAHEAERMLDDPLVVVAP